MTTRVDSWDLNEKKSYTGIRVRRVFKRGGGSDRPLQNACYSVYYNDIINLTFLL